MRVRVCPCSGAEQDISKGECDNDDMKTSLAPLIGHPTRWHNLLLTVEGQANRGGWGAHKEQVYGAILGEASYWTKLGAQDMDPSELENVARSSGQRLLEACHAHEELIKAIGARLYHDGHALVFWGWHLAQGRQTQHLLEVTAQRAVEPDGVAFVHMLHLWDQVPETMDSKGKIPWVGGRSGQSFLAPLTGKQHPLVLALGSGALESAKVFWDNLKNHSQALLDCALLATMAHIHKERLDEGSFQWVRKLLEAGANPSARHPISLGSSHHCVAHGPAGVAPVPGRIRQAVEEDGRWRIANDYQLISLGAWPKEEGSITANDLVLANLLVRTPLHRQWHELWKDYWEAHPPIMGFPWNSSPTETLLKIMGDFHHRQPTMKREEAEDFLWVADHLLPTLARHEKWWESTPSVEQPWPAWETAVYTMNMQIPGTGLKSNDLGTFLLERLLGTLPEDVTLTPGHVRDVAQAVIENANLVPMVIKYITDGQDSHTSISVNTNHELLEKSLDLVISRTHQAGQNQLMDQKAKLIEELMLAGNELVDEMREARNSGLDTGNFRDAAGARKRRLLLMAQTLAAPTRGTGPSIKM